MWKQDRKELVIFAAEMSGL